MQFHAVIIGDEIISGKRQDKHMSALIRILAARGLKLASVHFVGDQPNILVDLFKDLSAMGGVVFSFGGIGATPDDFTRQCVAKAQDKKLELHPEAKEILERRFGDEAYPYRIEMGIFPENAVLIPNPINEIPGFSSQNIHCVPGFPKMAWPMIEWALDTYYADQFNFEPDIEKSMIAIDAREGDIIGLMREYSRKYPSLKMFSLPCFGNEAIPKMHIEFGFVGQSRLVEIALAEWIKEMAKMGYETRLKK